MKDFIHWLNLAIKTILSIAFTFVVTMLVVDPIVDLGYLTASRIIGFIVFCIVGWLVCPREVKNGIKNW